MNVYTEEVASPEGPAKLSPEVREPTAGKASSSDTNHWGTPLLTAVFLTPGGASDGVRNLKLIAPVGA